MTREEMDFIGSMNMCDEISNEAYKKIMTHCEEREPCEDSISRNEALNLFDEAEKSESPNLSEDWKKLIWIKDHIEVLPSVTLQPRIGRWLEKEVIYNAIEEWQSARCSVCDRYHTTPYMYYFDDYKFCPNCGCQMKGENE